MIQKNKFKNYGKILVKSSILSLIFIMSIIVLFDLQKQFTGFNWLVSNKYMIENIMLRAVFLFLIQFILISSSYILKEYNIVTKSIRFRLKLVCFYIVIISYVSIAFSYYDINIVSHPKLIWFVIFVSSLFAVETFTVIYNIYYGVKERLQSEKDLSEFYHKYMRMDYLTKLPNKFALYKDIPSILSSNDSFYLLFLDLDRFKNVNDTLGRGIGDLILKDVSNKLKKFCSDKILLYRFEGDEFLFILLDFNDNGSICSFADSILEELNKPFLFNDIELYVTSSIGISKYPDNGICIENLLKNSDAAMHNAKNNGRNRYEFYSHNMNEISLDKLNLEGSLRKAITKNELFLNYQPKVDINTGKVVCVEALCRWYHNDLGIISPDAFIPIAEETGLIIDINRWVLGTACRQNKIWQDMGLKPVRVAVNLSASQFYQENFIDIVIEVLNDTGLSPEFLELEITESIIIKNPERVAGILKKLRTMGITISIDDFGTGYSSLNYLRQLYIDELKIDKSFIKDINSQNGALITKTIITLGHSLGLKVTAEGVENTEQLSFLKDHGCDMIQGFLFSPPKLPKEIEELIR